MDFNQSWVIDATWESWFVDEVKGHISRFKRIGWKCESGLIYKVDVQLEPNLACWYNMGPFVCSCIQRSYMKVKGHQRSSCKIGSKCKIHLIWRVEVGLEPNLVYWYNVRTFTCSWGQRSQMKVKGHVRLICKIAWKCKIWLICILEDHVTPTGLGLRPGVNLYHLQTGRRH